MLEQDQFEWEAPGADRPSLSTDPEPEMARSLMSLWRSALDAMRDAVVRQHQQKMLDADAPEEGGGKSEGRN